MKKQAGGPLTIIDISDILDGKKEGGIIVAVFS